MKAILPMTLAVLFATACGDGSTVMDPADVTYAASLGIDIKTMTKTASGLYIKDEIVGTGTLAATGSAVTVDYTGWLPSGAQFDTSVGKSPLPISNLGSGQVIAGFDEGVTGMRVGGRRLLVIPSKLGYGSQGVGAIPGNSTIIFRIDLRTVTPR